MVLQLSFRLTWCWKCANILRQTQPGFAALHCRTCFLPYSCWQTFGICFSVRSNAFVNTLVSPCHVPWWLIIRLCWLWKWRWHQNTSHMSLTNLYRVTWGETWGCCWRFSMLKKNEVSPPPQAASKNSAELSMWYYFCSHAKYRTEVGHRDL